MNRLSHDELFLQIALLMSQRATCGRGKVGCVIVKDRRIVSTGYNGSPPHQPHCDDVGCDSIDLVEVVRDGIMSVDPDGKFSYYYAAEKAQAVIEKLGLQQTGCRRTIHAEANAIAWAARHGTPTEGATLYNTHGPCLACAQLIASCGIERVVFITPYRLPVGRQLLEACGIQVNESNP